MWPQKKKNLYGAEAQQVDVYLCKLFYLWIIQMIELFLNNF